ncbi:hypothetical protein DHEL01_v207710 [Diaporthe helianthi]|uniref:Uncharacterized protein n=1 Tax=Diaporthe helianthi TaxID=158607 RepID=A0A2P5HUF7_DIAHE|nr:hypothetical protein DHEL01_v207710 [Diaporthe helianthi]
MPNVAMHLTDITSADSATQWSKSNSRMRKKKKKEKKKKKKASSLHIQYGIDLNTPMVERAVQNAVKGLTPLEDLDSLGASGVL